MPRLALTGGAYQSRSVIASAQRSLNLYAEPMPQAQGEAAPAAHYPTPGLTLLTTLPQNNVRAIKQATTGGVYAVAGNGVYAINPSNWSSTQIGSITSLRPYPASMQDNGTTLVIVDGSANGWTVDLASNAFAQIGPTQDPGGMFAGADKVDYLDTYLLFNKPGTPQFYSSLSESATFDPYALDFANKSIFSDLLITLAVAKREIWLLGERTTEVWYDYGPQTSTDFQFQPMQGVFVDHGCAAKYSAATYDNAVYWLGYDRAGQGIVLSGAGYQATRVSTYAIEAELATYPTISDAIGFCYSLQGHNFYVLTFPTADRTWVLDIETKAWHEWLWIDDNGHEHRHRANCAYAINGQVVVGDWENGNLYRVDPAAYTDNGQPIKRQRSYPHITQDFNRVFYRQFMADLESGNPLPPPVATDIITQIITWPPEIAHLIGASDGIATLVAADWQRGVVYFTDYNVYQSYALNLATQAAPATSAVAPGDNPAVFAVDPFSGDLLVQRGTVNGEPVYKLNPTTFAVISSFGTTTSFPSYPSSVWVGEGLVCIVCNGVSYGLLKYSEFYGVVAAFRIDTMAHAGFAATVVSGSTDNRGAMCAGASGGSAASAFLTWEALQYTATIPLYVVTITAAANGYNPSTWPTTNPGISWATIGTIAASAVDPTQPNLACNSIGYDLADGNVLMWVTTGTSAAVNAFIVKVHSTNAAVLWTVPIDTNARVSLEHSRINGSLWVFSTDSAGHAHTSWQIDTIAGTATTRSLGGTFNTLPGYPIFDSESQVALYAGDYWQGTQSPVPADSGTVTSAGWFLMGGATARTTTTVAADTSHRIFLDWSDDRGHSYGNPVHQSIGSTGAYLTALQWQRLGMARDRVFRLTWSVPVKTALQGAWIEIQGVGKS